jgi:hypothetical protein
MASQSISQWSRRLLVSARGMLGEQALAVAWRTVDTVSACRNETSQSCANLHRSALFHDVAYRFCIYLTSSHTKQAGADILLCDSFTNAAWSCQDTYATSESNPIADAHQDWVLISAETSGMTTTMHVQRAANTGDLGQDRPLNHENQLSQLLVFAMGKGSSVSYHGNDMRWRQKVKLAGGHSIAEVLAGLEAAAGDPRNIVELRNPAVAVNGNVRGAVFLAF